MDNAGRTKRAPGGWRMSRSLSSVRGRIIAGFGFLVLILVGIVAGTIWLVVEHRSDTAAMEDHADTAFLLQNGLANAEAAAAALQRYVVVGEETRVTGDEALVAQIRSYMAAAEESLAQALASTEIRGDSEQATRLYQINAQADSLISGSELVIDLRQDGSGQEAATALEVSVLPFRKFEDGLKAAAAAELQEVSSLRNQADRAGDLALWLLIVSGVAGAVLGLGTSALVARSIIGPLSSLEETAIAISNGNLEARTRATGPRELANLGSALNQMTESLLDASKRRELEELVQKFALLVQHSDDFIAMSSLDGDMQFVNNAGRELVGLHKDESISSMTIADFLTDEGREQSLDIEVPAVKENGHWSGESSLRHFRTGEAIPVHINSFLVRDTQSGNPMVLATVQRDITERKQAEEALRRSKEYFRSLTENASDVILVLDDNGAIRYASPSVNRAIGLEAADLIGSRAFDGIVHTDDLAGVSSAFAAAVQDRGASVSIAARVRHKDGSWRTLEGTVRNLLGDPAVTGLVLNCRDITERKQAEETIEHLAYHDALTDLPNRTLLKDRLTVALAQGRRRSLKPAVLFLDLDEFKVVNDTVGHVEGDELLRQVAEGLMGLVREGDTVARMGGDEFTLVLSEVTGVEDAVEVAARVLEHLRRPWLLNGQEFHVSASIGIAMYPGDGEDAETLLRNADTAMYGAKKKGRDNYQLYTPEMNARIAERLALENSLRHALERGEFVVHYQPQVNIGTGQVVGVEALVRWQRPERGLILPGEFISMAEEIGLIVPLGEWVLRTACAQNKAWQEAGLPPIRVAVNLSVRQFQERGLLDTVAQTLQETGLDPACLQLEITEGAAMDDADFTITTLRNLREIGVQIAIDDFGTGHSSLAYLKRFPIDVVKIDRSFVCNLTFDATDAAIATTVIAMARSLNLQVIAEGVETEQQLAFLREQQCDEMQGYLFAEAVPAPTLERLLTQGKRLLAPADVPSGT